METHGKKLHFLARRLSCWPAFSLRRRAGDMCGDRFYSGEASLGGKLSDGAIERRYLAWDSKVQGSAAYSLLLSHEILHFYDRHFN